MTHRVFDQRLGDDDAPAPETSERPLREHPAAPLLRRSSAHRLPVAVEDLNDAGTGDGQRRRDGDILRVGKYEIGLPRPEERR